MCHSPPFNQSEQNRQKFKSVILLVQTDEKFVTAVKDCEGGVRVKELVEESKTSRGVEHIYLIREVLFGKCIK